MLIRDRLTKLGTDAKPTVEDTKQYRLGFNSLPRWENEPDTSRRNTAELLRKAIEDKEFTRDPATRDHFGTSKVNSLRDAQNLMGLYRDLMVLPDYPTTSDLHKWQRKNTLAVNVVEEYERQGGRSWYLNWFKEKTHLVDQNYVKEDPLTDFKVREDSDIEQMRWHYLDGDGRCHFQQPLHHEGFAALQSPGLSALPVERIRSSPTCCRSTSNLSSNSCGWQGERCSRA